VTLKKYPNDKAPNFKIKAYSLTINLKVIKCNMLRKSTCKFSEKQRFGIQTRIGNLMGN
jgi:hypothetical protein